MRTAPAALVLALFRDGKDSLDIARALGLTEPAVCRLLAAAREEERSARRAG